MKIKFFFLSLLVSSALFAKDYSYISFFESNIKRSEAELLSMQGKKAKYLDKFHCTVFRDDLFANDFQKNPKKNSLKIMTKNGDVLTYSKGLIGIDKFSKSVVKALSKIESSQIGRSLIERLMSGPYPLWIKSGGNRFDPRSFDQRPMFGINEAGALTSFLTNRLQVDRLEFDTWGSGGFVLWDSNNEFMAMESDGVSRKTPTYIALGHELYHAYDSIRGFLDRRMIKGEGYEFQPVIEYRAVYFENLLRAEAGRKYRKYYSPPSKAVIGSMLDEFGEPIFIPTDCLK
ncbi:MAG: hypothetical protein ACJAT2_000720 [Bacteriovoracaceae bacterium]|jgi:hypothetical protein